VSSSPPATAAVAASSLRTGRSTQRDSGHATATTASSGSSPVSASQPHWCSTSARNRSVGDTVTTAATTSLSLPTGSTTTSGTCCHGHTTCGPSGR
jgi:hypothetical protein